MATNMNSVSVVGNATREPELRFTPSGQAIATFGIAVNRSWRNKQSNEWEEAVSFFDVTCWAQMAENVAESVTKGTRVLVTGRLEQRSWETNDGEKRSKVEIVAEEIGPSLRFATAGVTKNERRGGDFEGGGGGGGNSAPRAVANDAPGGYSNDEEPF